MSQCLSMTLCYPFPGISILGRWVACFCRWVNQTVFWWKVVLRGEGRYNISLIRYQLSWRQTALQGCRRSWQRRHEPKDLANVILEVHDFNCIHVNIKVTIAMQHPSGVEGLVFSPAMKSSPYSPKSWSFASNSCVEIKMTISIYQYFI